MSLAQYVFYNSLDSIPNLAPLKKIRLWLSLLYNSNSAFHLTNQSILPKHHFLTLVDLRVQSLKIAGMGRFKLSPDWTPHMRDSALVR